MAGYGNEIWEGILGATPLLVLGKVKPNSFLFSNFSVSDISSKMKKIYIGLTGGLGNQLFQFAAGRSCVEDGTLYLFSCLGVPRSSENGPDILDFDLGKDVKILPCDHRHILSKKFYNLLVSLTVGGRGWILKISFIQHLVSFVARQIFRLELGIKVKIHIAKGIGYSSIKEDHENLFPIGYFQTFKPLVTGERSLQSSDLSLTRHNPEIDLLKSKSLENNPLVVHVRLGDYKLESNFGILDSQYYSSAIDSAMSDKNIKEIWLFSDETDLALMRIPQKYLPITKVLDLNDFSPAEVLEVMRFGYAYVIANSTFSWWGAFLAYKENARVIAPSRWFRNMDEPLDLIPVTWERFLCNLELGIE